MGKGERKYGGVVNTLMKRITWNIYINLDERKKDRKMKEKKKHREIYINAGTYNASAIKIKLRTYITFFFSFSS